MAATLESWGRRVAPGAEILSEDLERITPGRPLSRGLARSYGDACLPAPGCREIVGTVLADRILAFDKDSGLLRAEAGLSLRDLVRLFLPRGFFVPVTPGTMFVTLGGMVAADVHGKNHHRDGCFGAHVTSLRLRLADGRIVAASRAENADLFRATLGGMGLTGHILEVEFRMVRVPTPWILRESQRIDDLEAFVAGLKASARDWPFTVGWIDCLSRGRHMGRGILYRGRWAEPHEAPRHPPHAVPRLTVPFLFPEWALSRPAIRAFNELYYRAHLARSRRRVVHPEPFFYPLDAILHWNRIYGRRGFFQYQCVLPETSARRFLELLTSLGGASFLCVIKDCGPEGEGMLSFPKPGISIALDMAVRDDTQRIVDALNERVIAEGGRVYLAKDAFTRPGHFRLMEPRLAEFERARERWDPERRMKSAQSVRVLGDGP
ncbi:MAG TPA: FAD-binding oxidoreductase [Vicinamibacteria bacterium]|nr:FAD-binding oxidoreductase [Vicinamibacteria bacterium]